MSILIGFSIINHQFWGNPIFGTTHMVQTKDLFAFFAYTYRGYGLFSTIQDSEPRMSQFPWVNIFFRGQTIDWQTKSTNAMTQICSTQRLIFDFALLDHRRTDLSRFSRTFFAGTNHFFIKPRAFQQAEAEATARADWPTWSLVYLSWGWVPVDWLMMITACSCLFRYHMQKQLRGCSPQSFNTKLSAHLRGRRIGPSGSRLDCVKKCQE